MVDRLSSPLSASGPVMASITTSEAARIFGLPAYFRVGLTKNGEANREGLGDLHHQPLTWRILRAPISPCLRTSPGGSVGNVLGAGRVLIADLVLFNRTPSSGSESHTTGAPAAFVADATPAAMLLGLLLGWIVSSIALASSEWRRRSTSVS